MSIPTSTTIYGKVIPQKSKSSVTSKISKIIGFKYPIDSTPLRGYFVKQSGDDLLRTMIRNLIRTERGERFMLPDYGCNAKRYLMEPLDEYTFEQIKTEVVEAINKYLRRVDLSKIRVYSNKPSFGYSNSLVIQLFCRLRGDDNVNLDVNMKI